MYKFFYPAIPLLRISSVVIHMYKMPFVWFSTAALYVLTKILEATQVGEEREATYVG